METLLGPGNNTCCNNLPKMRHEPADLPHTQWAQQDPPPRGTWIAHVRSMQQRLGIPDICIFAGKVNRSKKTVMRQVYTDYARQVVEPAIQGARGSGPRAKSLPWSWINTCLTQPQQIQIFETWLSWRIRDQPPWACTHKCCMRQAISQSTTLHVTDACQTAAWIAQEKGANIRDSLEIPDVATQVMAQLVAVREISLCWDHKRISEVMENGVLETKDNALDCQSWTHNGKRRV